MANPTRRDFLKTAAMSSAASMILFSSCRRERRRPNIVLIMADDVGREVLGCYDGTSYKTPNLDRLAETGIRFTHCYSSAKCAPSRVKIMTGRYQFRTTEEWGHIPQEERTVSIRIRHSHCWQMADGTA
jgi:arylsulfatase A